MSKITIRNKSDTNGAGWYQSDSREGRNQRTGTIWAWMLLLPIERSCSIYGRGLFGSPVKGRDVST